MAHLALNAVTLASTLILSVKNPQKVPILGTQIWISDPKMVEAQPLASNQALLIGKQIGEAFIYGLPDQSLNRVVVTTEANRLALTRCPQSRELLSANVDGSLSVSSWSKEFSSQISSCGFDFLSAQNISLLNEALSSTATALQKIHMSPSMAAISRGRIHWKVEHSKISELKSALGHLRSFCDFEEFQPEQKSAIVFKLDLFEFSHSIRDALDLSAQSGTSLVGASTSQNSKLAFLYQRAKQSGRLLASPLLRTTPGKKATFNSGGEIPIQDAHLTGTKTTWKSYGLKVDLTPLEGSSPQWPHVNTKVEIEYLQPDYGTGSGDIPSMITRNLRNEFDLPIEQTTLLTSMIYVHQNQSNRSQGGLGAIPLLGSLFSSSGSHHNESELWFLITPQWAASHDNENKVSETWNQHGKL